MIRNILIIIGTCVLGFIATIIISNSIIQSKSISVHIPFQDKFSLEKAPTESLVGNIATLSGVVLWQSRVADSPANITNSLKILQGEELLTGDSGNASIDFPNVLTTQLLSNTHIAIVQTLKANIVIKQVDGQVVYTGFDNHIPISVRVLDLLLTFTKGNVTVTLNTKKSEVTVEEKEGTITAAYTDSNNMTQVLTLSKGKRLTFNNNTKSVEYYFL